MKSTGMGTTEGSAETPTKPRAIIHKKILQAAERNPDASMEELAEKVNAATTDLVENVLTKYGDPGDQPDNSGNGENDSGKQAVNGDKSSDEDQSEDKPEGTSTNGVHFDDDNGSVITDGDPRDVTKNGHRSQANSIDATDLTEKQIKTLRAIYENPDATQTELADRFGVTPATLNTRVNSIEGFDWSNREAFVQQMFENDPTDDHDSATDRQSIEELSERIDRIGDQVETIENQLSQHQSQSQNVIHQPDLTHKILHACLRSDEITKEEELEILKGAIDSE